MKVRLTQGRTAEFDRYFMAAQRAYAIPARGAGLAMIIANRTTRF